MTNKASEYRKRFVWVQHSEAADPGRLVLLFGTMVIEKVMVDVLGRGSSLAAEGK